MRYGTQKEPGLVWPFIQSLHQTLGVQQMCSTESALTGQLPVEGGIFVPESPASLGGDSEGGQTRPQLGRPSGCFIRCCAQVSREQGREFVQQKPKENLLGKEDTSRSHRQDLSQLRGQD